ncbi:MAG: maltose ABC transporter permease MalF [Actinomycetota bacterium]|nr:maltose ABC transporter permease MalF [Actinomycetota bacterium]
MTDLRQRAPDTSVKDRTGYGTGWWLKMAGIALLDAVAVWAAVVLVADGAWLFLTGLVVGSLFINWVYLWPRTKALRWITPGLVLMAVFLIIPIVYTFYISFTNWATGNVVQKPQAIAIIESRSFVDPDAPGALFDLHVYQDGEELRLLLIGADGALVFGEPRLRNEDALADATEDPVALGITDADGDGVPEQIGPYRLLSRPQVFALANTLAFDQLVIDSDVGQVQILGLSQGRVVQATQRYRYDAATDTMNDLVGDQACRPGDAVTTRGNFVCEDGTELDPGWVETVGSTNYTSILTNQAIRRPFLGVFTWNVVFALVSVASTFALGLGLALTMQHERLRGRTLYRSIFILPYAVPAFLSILIWQGLFNTRFGQVNGMLEAVGIDPIAWFSDPTWARTAVLLVNLWLGFPYMYLICTGALQAIPIDLIEAARVDGAGPFTVFRRITFPLLMVALAPLLIGSFAFNFNNFVLIYLLTAGGPAILDAAVPVGATDILITFTFDLAVASGAGNRFGLGAAITVFIFILVMVISSLSFRYTKRLENIYGAL